MSVNLISEVIKKKQYHDVICKNEVLFLGKRQLDKWKFYWIQCIKNNMLLDCNLVASWRNITARKYVYFYLHLI